MAKEKSNKAACKALKAVGILLAVLGVIVIIFAAVWLPFGSATGMHMRSATGLPNNGTFNQSGFNQSRFNSARGGYRFGLAGTYIEGVIIGILMLLLGIVTFKYAGLRQARK